MNRKRGLLLLIVTLFWFGQYVYVPFQTPYLLGLGASSTFAGLVVGGYGACQVLLRLPVGLLADVRGRHKGFILLGLCSSALASAVRCVSPTGWGFFLGNLLSGIAASMWISFMVLYSSYFPAGQMQKATGTIIAANNLGMLLAFVAGTLCYEHTGMVFLCGMSLTAASLGALCALAIREDGRTGRELPAATLLGICRNRRLILFSLLALLQQGIQMSTCMSFTTEAIERIGGTSGQIGLCSILYMLCAVLSAYAASTRLVSRWGARVWVPLVLGLVALYCVLVPNVTQVEWFYLIQLLPGLSTGILLSYCTSEAMAEVPDEMRSTAMGFFQAVYAVGMTLLPLLTGELERRVSVQAGFYVLAMLAAVGCGVALFYYARQRHLLER
ncbi:MAG: MFS transporter [Eubacteriales bacterium]|jgi:MFS family permease